MGFYLAVAWGAVTVAGELTDILDLPAATPRVVLLADPSSS